MFGRELAFAISLIVAPIGTPLPDLDADDWLQVQSALHRVCIDWELVDEREKRYIFSKPESLLDDIENVRRRRENLVGAPRVIDAQRFPSRAIANRMLEENNALRCSIESRMELETDRRSGFRIALYELSEIQCVWSLVQRAQATSYLVWHRREFLKKLLDELGHDDYAAAKLPPSTPIWRFRP